MQNELCAKFKFFAIHREYIAKIINAEIKDKRTLRDEANKTELFGFLSRKVVSFNYLECKEVAILLLLVLKYLQKVVINK